MTDDTNQRFTPQHVLAVIREFADIALDPCTTADNPTGADVFVTAERNALAADADWYRWSCQGSSNLCFVNPPYGRGHLLVWTAAMKRWGMAGCEIIGLVPADMSTAWMRVLLGSATAIAFWNKRIAFGTAGGGYEDGAKFGNAFVYYGERQGRFKRVFSPHAHVLVLR